jgi:threonine dehydrogenase-like Zn-dependent dehydrogenase
MPDGMSPESAVYLDPGIFALAGIRDGAVSLGDRVAIFGLGAIGQMAVQMARLSGAVEVFGVDLFSLRRKMAERYGATRAIDPAGCDVGRMIKEETRGMGVDVALELSGASAALHAAIRATARGGRIVTVGCPEGGASDLRLGEDWARNQQVMIASRGTAAPGHGHGSWVGRRLNDTVWRLLARGDVKTEGLVTPVVPFEEAAEAYEKADKNPKDVVKFAVRYS